MDPAQPQLAVFEYKHGDRITLSGPRKILFFVSLIVSLALSKLLFPFGLLTLIVPVMTYLGGGRTLVVGPRYFICGRQIFYYANITKLKFSELEGVLNLQTANGNQFTIERQRFSSDAGKETGVTVNRVANFNKATGEIIERVRRAVPTVADT